MPFALIFLFGQIFGVNRPASGPSAIPLAVVDESRGPEAAQFLDALRSDKSFRLITESDSGQDPSRPLAEADLRPLIRAGKFRFALVLPSDFSGAKRPGLHLQILSDPRNAIETQTVTGLLQRDLYTTAPQLLGLAPRSVPSAAGTGPAENFLSHLIRIDREQVVGAEVAKPMATQLVGGWAVQFLLFALVSSAIALSSRKGSRPVPARILSGPVSRADILWSKFLCRVSLGLLQLLVLFTAGGVLFGIQIAPHLPLLLLVCLFAAGACSAFGMLLASIARTPEMARGLATFVILLMSAIGGAWFPVSFMPDVMQHFSRLTLVYWSIEGFLQVLWVHASLVELLPTLGVLAGMTLRSSGSLSGGSNAGQFFD